MGTVSSYISHTYSSVPSLKERMYSFTYDTNVSKMGFEVSAYIGTPLLPSTIGMLEMEVISFCLPRLTLNLALMAGSSKQGKARLASVGWNCVTAMYLEWKIILINLYNCANTALTRLHQWSNPCKHSDKILSDCRSSWPRS